MTASSHSDAFNHGRSCSGVDNNDTHQSPQFGVHRIAPHEGYDAGDGYTIPQPQLWSTTNNSGSTGDMHGSNHATPPSNRRARRRSFDWPPDEFSDKDDDDDEEDADQLLRPRRRKSKPKLRMRLSHFLFDGYNDGAGNTELKKWSATLAGAVLGGLAAKQAKLDHWVPAALGACAGGFVARETEKEFYRKREIRDREKAYGGGKSHSRSGSGLKLKR